MAGSRGRQSGTATALVRPRDGRLLLRKLRTQVGRVRPQSDAAEVEPVRIPAGDDGHIAPGAAEFVVADGFVEECKVLVAQVQQRPPQRRGEVGRTFAVAW